MNTFIINHAELRQLDCQKSKISEAGERKTEVGKD